ncbi:hypothetical protein H1Q63_20015 [Desmonostoc muscorum CCALA 125]|nr:hypothetical protein [Desmonostoc muscorum CCALA 125]
MEVPNTSKVQVDATKVQVDATKVQVNTSKVQIKAFRQFVEWANICPPNTLKHK